MRQALKFYEFFMKKGYTKKEIDQLISNQTPEMQQFLQRRFGQDYKSLIENDWTKSEYYHYYGNVVKRFVKELQTIRNEKRTRKPRKKVETEVTDNTSNLPTKIESDVKVYTKPEENLRIYKNEKEEIKDQLLEIGPQLMNYFASYPFNRLVYIFGEEEALIAFLRFKLINNKTYSSEEVSNILGIDQEKVNEVVRAFYEFAKKEIYKKFEQIDNPGTNKINSL